MDSKVRSSILLALAEVVKDSEVIELLCEKSGEFDDLSELDLLEKITKFWTAKITKFWTAINF